MHVFDLIKDLPEGQIACFPLLTYAKSQQHPKDFPGGHPPQYYPGLALLNFGVQMGSGVFKAVWPLTLVRPTFN